MSADPRQFNNDDNITGEELIKIFNPESGMKSTTPDKLREYFMLDVLYGDTYWDDLRVPLTQTKIGALSKPDFDTTNIGLLFPQNDASEMAYFVTQMPHSWKEGTGVFPHVHWRQSAATAVTWKLDYKIIPLNQEVPAAFTTISGATPVFQYVSGNLSQITSLGEIAMTGENISALIVGKLYRDDNVTTGDVLGWEIDFHYEIDRPGSRDEYIK